MEDGIFPSYASIMNPDEIGEERRLAYVGITRAKEKLYLTKTRSRMLFGSTTFNKASRFLNEIPDELINYTGNENKYAASDNSQAPTAKTEKISVGQKAKMSYAKSMYKKPAAQSGVVYKVGDTVLHKVFGRGMVMKTEKMGNDTLLEISFDKAGTKNLMANFSKMEKT